MADYGRVLAVTTHTAGDQLVGDHAAGVTVLNLDDSVDFPEDGGTVSTDIGLLDFTAVDPENDTMTLVYPLSAGLPDEAQIELWDEERNAVVTETTASLALEGSDDDGDPFEADVPQNLRGYLPEGLRGDRGEIVGVDVAEGVVLPPGDTPALDGQVIWHPHSVRSATKTIPTAVHTKVNGWAEVETDGVDFTTGAWTIRTPGWYEMTLSGEWDFNTTGRRRLRILVNDEVFRVRVEAADPDDTTYMDVTTQRRFDEGEQVTVWAYQTSGARLAVTASFAIYRISV